MSKAMDGLLTETQITLDVDYWRLQAEGARAELRLLCKTHDGLVAALREIAGLNIEAYGRFGAKVMIDIAKTALEAAGENR